MVDWGFGYIILLAWIVAAVLFAPAFYFSDQVNKSVEADRANWNTVTAINLPINVTRIITADRTSFTYAPAGDEAFLFFSLGGESLGTFEGPSEAVRVSAPVSARLYREWPAVELKVIRMNGTEEIYSLPIRGGAVRWAFD